MNISKSTSSITDQQRLYFSLWFTMLFLISIWGVFFIDKAFDLNLTYYGNRPRELRGLNGIFTYPFLHGGWSHIWNNSASFFVLNSLLFYFYRSLAIRVWSIMFISSGILLWLFGGTGNHIGASGMIYGLASFLFISGLVRKNLLLLRVTLLVVFLYGGMVWLMLPIKEHVSWEGHLSGAVCGAFLAFFFRNRGPKNPIYKYEISEAAHEDLPDWWMRGNPNHPDTIAQRLKEANENALKTENELEQGQSTHSGAENVKYHWIPTPKKKKNLKDPEKGPKK